MQFHRKVALNSLSVWLITDRYYWEACVDPRYDGYDYLVKEGVVTPHKVFSLILKYNSLKVQCNERIKKLNITSTRTYITYYICKDLNYLLRWRAEILIAGFLHHFFQWKSHWNCSDFDTQASVVKYDCTNFTLDSSNSRAEVAKIRSPRFSFSFLL